MSFLLSKLSIGVKAIEVSTCVHIYLILSKTNFYYAIQGLKSQLIHLNLAIRWFLVKS